MMALCAHGEGQVRKFPALCHSLLLFLSSAFALHNLRNALLRNAEHFGQARQRLATSVPMTNFPVALTLGRGDMGNRLLRQE